MRRCSSRRVKLCKLLFSINCSKQRPLLKLKISDDMTKKMALEGFINLHKTWSSFRFFE